MPEGAAAKAPAKADSMPSGQPSPVFEDEILNWDCALEIAPPPARSGRIEVMLRRVEAGPSPF